jgi:hypothetical protein
MGEQRRTKRRERTGNPDFMGWSKDLKVQLLSIPTLISLRWGYILIKPIANIKYQKLRVYLVYLAYGMSQFSITAHCRWPFVSPHDPVPSNVREDRTTCLSLRKDQNSKFSIQFLLNIC